MTTVTDGSLDQAWQHYMSEGCLADPVPFYRRLRDTEPVYWTPSGFWFLTRHTDAVAIFRDDDGHDGSAWSKQAVNASEASHLVSGDGYMARFFRTEVHHTDGAYHTRLRKLLNKSFTPRAVERIRETTRAMVEAQLDAIERRPGCEMELMADLAVEIPTTVILAMLDISVDEFDRMNEMADFVIYSHELAAGNDTTWIERADAVFSERHEFVLRLAEQRRRNPGGDLLSSLATVTDEHGDALTDLELTMNVCFLVVAGFETTMNTIGSAVHLLLSHPDQLALLRNDASLYRPAVEETLRYAPAVRSSSPRWAARDLELGGRKIRRGDMVRASIIAANHDPAEFPDPDRFDITRDPDDGRHLAFASFSAHFCLGAALARMEIVETLQALFTRFPTLRLTTDDIAYKKSFVIRGPEAVPLGW
jgi:cytochrome P450